MAVAFDAAFTASSAVAVYSWTHTPVGTPSTVFVGVGVRENLTTTSGVTYGGQTMIRVRGVNNAALNRWDIFKLDSPPTGPQTVEVTLAAAQESAAISCTVTGAGTNQPSSWNNQAGTVAAVKGNVISEDTNSLVLGFVHVERNNTDAQIVPVSPQTQRATVSGPTADRPRIELATQTGVVGSVVCAWTLTTADDWLVAAMNVSQNDGGFANSLAGKDGTVKTAWRQV